MSLGKPDLPCRDGLAAGWDDDRRVRGAARGAGVVDYEERVDLGTNSSGLN